MPTHPSILPSYTSSSSRKYNFKRTQFGDGQSQRFKKGIQPVVRTWSMTYAQITDSEAETLMDFYDDLAGAGSFDWTPPGSETSVKVISGTPDRQWTKFDTNTVTVEFEEVFDL